MENKSEKDYNSLLRFLSENLNGEKIPDVLYQYTDITALKGIVEKNEMWATHYKFLNDKNEFNFGLQLAIDYAKKHYEKESSKFSKEFLDSLRFINEDCVEREIYPFPKTDIYTISFSSKGDLLSQWRGYGKKYKSTCIGFLTSSFLHRFNTERCNYFLQKVVYDTETQKEIIYEFMKRECRVFSNNPADFEDNPHYFNKILRLILVKLIMLILCFKENCWREEDEWRIMTIPHNYSTGKPFEIFFNEGDYGLVPFVKIPLFKSGSAIDSIKEILLPRSENYITSKKALDLFLNQKKNDNKIEIKKSDISIVYK